MVVCLGNMRFSKKTFFLYGPLVALFLFVLPQIALVITSRDNIVQRRGDVTSREYAVVFGAKVYDDGSMSPILKERLDAAVQLYLQERVQKLYLSGTNTDNDEVEVMEHYVMKQGVAPEDIQSDHLGVKTYDTCVHAAAEGVGEAVFVTQGFHLPRTMHLCKRAGVEGQGIAVNFLGLRSAEDQLSWRDTATIRTKRFVRESALTWLFTLGIYQRVPDLSERNAEVEKGQESFSDLPVDFRVLSYDFDDREGDVLVFAFEPDQVNVSLAHKDNPLFVSSWAKDQGNALVINGGYFHDDFSPSGFLYVDGKRIGDRAFDKEVSGLIEVRPDRGVNIRDLAVDPLSLGEPLYTSIQSYPFLLKNGERAIREDSGKRARRTALGVDREGGVYVFIEQTSQLSLYELMVVIDESDIENLTVLNLDGGPSTGLSIKKDDQHALIDSYWAVPNILSFSLDEG